MPTTTEQRERAKKGIKARQDAVAELIANHQDEFTRLHIGHRVALGLPPTSMGPTREQLQERIRRQEEKLSRWREQLEASS